MNFEWDPRKEAANQRKHGVGFDEALTVFADLMARIFDDPDHSASEAREIIRPLLTPASVDRLFQRARR